jgi:hypothetical protein
MQARDMNELNRKVIDFGNDMLAFEHMAMSGYDSAISGFSSDYPGIADKLREFRLDHERHVRELDAVVCACGGEPRTTPHLKAVFKKPLMELKRLQGGESLLGGMVSNEEAAVEQYDWAVKEATNLGFRSEIVNILRRALEDERRHLAYCVQQYESFRTRTKISAPESAQKPIDARPPRVRGDRKGEKA